MKSFKKIFLMLTSFAMVVGTLLIGGGIKKTETVEAATKSVTYEFGEYADFSTWDSGYVTHEMVYPDVTVNFSKTNKQSTTIDDMPVTKSGEVSFKVTSNYYVSSFTFTCKQWLTKAKTMTLHYSVDGINYVKTSSTGSSSSATNKLFFATYSDTTNINGICSGKATFSNASNQVGIKSLTIELVEKEYNVSFVDSDGNSLCADQKANSSGEYKIVSPSNPIKEGYTFNGWYLEEEGKDPVKWDFLNNVVEKDMKLVAHYSINSYKVTFDLNGGTINGSTDSIISNVEYNNKVSAPVDPVKSGFVFKSWNIIDSEGKITTTEYNFENLITGELTLMANYEKITEPLAVITPSQQTYYVNDKIIVNAELNNVPEDSTYELIWSFDPSVEGIVAKDEESSTPTKLVLDALKPGEVMFSVTLKYSGNSYSNNDNTPLVTILEHPISSVETKSWLGLSYEGDADGTIDLNVASIAKENKWGNHDLLEFPTGRDDLSIVATNGTTTNTRYYNDEWRFYAGSSLKIKSSTRKISKLTITYSENKGALSYRVEENDEAEIKKMTSGNPADVNSDVFIVDSVGKTFISSIKIEFVPDLKFTSIRARFGITIPTDMYQFESIESANVSFKVYINDATNPTVVKMTDANKTINEDKSITYVVSVVGIPLANCTDTIHVVPTVTINGHSYELTGTAYSVSDMVEAYLNLPEFKDNAYLNALYAAIVEAI